MNKYEHRYIRHCRAASVTALLSFPILFGLNVKDCFPLTSNHLILSLWNVSLLPHKLSPARLLSQLADCAESQTEIKLKPIVNTRGSVTSVKGGPR